jgi:hypothetical protein
LIRALIPFVLLPAVGALPSAAIQRAAELFREAEALSRKDDGRLWKVYLRGPSLILDPESGEAWSNEELPGWRAAAKGIWEGRCPEAKGRPAISLQGRWWTVMALPAPSDTLERQRWVARALFRRIEPSLGYSTRRPAMAHLKEPEARRWLLLEAAALRRALGVEGAQRADALEDALVFRAWRRTRFRPESGAERIAELNEGMAEYTAQALTTASPAERRRNSVTLLEGVSGPGFAPAFGLAYGVLMDLRNRKWRELLDGEVDLGFVLREVWNLTPPLVSGKEAERRASNYRGTKATSP